MPSQRIFITGATGFVGRHLIAHLNRRGGATRAEIFGSCFPERPESCADLCRAERNVRLVHLDLRDAAAVETVLASIRPARIYHLAALSQVRLSWEKRAETFDTNLRGTFNLFEAVRKHTPKARVLFVSSSDVYGFLEPRHRPCRERDRRGVVSPYAFTKVSGELLGEFYALRENVPIIAARPFPHTGPGQTADFVCSDWARQIALIEKFKAHGDAEAAGQRLGQGRAAEAGGGGGVPVIRVGNLALRRDYSDVRDIVRAYALLLAKGKPGEVYNVCSGRATSLEWVLKTLLSYSRRKIAYEIDPARVRKVDIPYLAGDNGKLRQATGWAPRIALEQTLRDILEYWRARV
ncbi:MAG: GDP-mannose 4,6-dehydratase [Candidatus Aminicenantes bacterium]|nr:GDP-mannose 4,6-dehydratase [Candidatus Aminicenantes bacterium]